MSSLPLSTSDASQEVKIRMAKEGLGAAPVKTVMESFDEVVAKHGSKPALYHKRPEKVRNNLNLRSSLRNAVLRS